MAITTLLFRWGGQYWGFVADGAVYDRHGRHVAWLEGRDVYYRNGRFMGELHDEHHVLRDTLRAEPIHRAPHEAVPHVAPPTPPPDREPRAPLQGWTDALPWPLLPPEPPRV